MTVYDLMNAKIYPLPPPGYDPIQKFPDMIPGDQQYYTHKDFKKLQQVLQGSDMSCFEFRVLKYDDCVRVLRIE